MGKVKKTTRKFNQKHLKTELERRNKNKKAQQLSKKRELKKKKRSANADTDDEADGFTGIEAVDELAGFAESTLKDADADMNKFIESDVENEGDSNDSTDDEDVAALLGDDDEDEDSEEADSNAQGSEGDGDEEEDTIDDEDSEFDDEDTFKKEFEAMKRKDPEFFEFMKKNDPGSLKILEQSSDEEEGDDEIQSQADGSSSDSEDQDVDMVDSSKPPTKPSGVLVTAGLLDGWEKEIKQSHSIKAFKQLLLAFYSASHMESEGAKTANYVYRIEGMKIFNKTVSTAIRVAPAAFGHLAPVANGKVDKKKSKKWNVVQALVKSYLTSLLELLKQMSDPTMIQYLIKESERMVPYIACFVRHTRAFVKELLRLFGSPAVDDGVRILVLLSLRQLVSLAPSEVTDMALKGIYLTYVRHSNVKNISSLTTIQLMRNCGVELYGADAKASYQHGFVYIRQLAIHLRNSMQLRSKESFRAIYNWQFINSLNFWTEVLATYCGDRAEEKPELCATLESLVYPLTQIVLGVVRLVPTAKYFPLRIHCISQLLRLSSATGIYIPLLPMIIEVLESPEFLSRRPVKSTLKPLMLESHLKVPREYEHTRVYLEVVLENVFGLLADGFASQSVRIAFPEWSVPAILQLRRWRKRVGASWSRFSKQLQGLLEKIDQTSRLIQQQRSKVDFAPSNLSGANQFMQDFSPEKTPVGQYAASLRKIQAQQRATLVEAEVEN
ncbi:Nucleolar Complex 2 protein [Coemansia sp. BCRC 34490]|nr:Nucleolar Complex 2 protein [Coemansia sp. BCRC 34490]